MHTRKLLGLWASVALLAACNSILGIEDASPIGDAGMAGSGGTSAAGGTAGSTGGIAGGGGASGGAAGTDGAAGTGGAAGSDAGTCTDTKSDPKNCGWCGHDCQGTACTDGLCAPVEVTALEPGAETMQGLGDSLFITGGWSWKFSKLPKLGGNLESWNGADDIYYLALHAGFAYFTEYNPKKIYRTSTTGSPAPNAIVTSTSIINSVAADDTGLYWGESGSLLIRRANLDGTGATNVVTNAYNAWHIATDATDIYFSNVNDGIFRLSKSVALPVDAASVPYFYDIIGDGPATMTLDGDWIYFSTGDPSYTFPVTVSQVMRKSKKSGALQTLGSSSTLVFAITVADGYAYWAEEGTMQNDFTDGAVRRVKLDSPGAQAETLADKQNHPVAIVVDGPWVYYLNSGWTSINGGVMRVAR